MVPDDRKARSTSAWAAVRRFVVRRRILVGVTAGSLLSLTGLLVWLGWRSGTAAGRPPAPLAGEPPRA